MNSVSASAATPCCMCFTDSASPPTSNCFTPASACTPLSTTPLYSALVSHSVSTPSRSINSPNSAALATRPGYSTSLPPRNSAPQISKVAASKALEAICSTTDCWSNRTYAGSCTSRSTFACVTAIPFGWPVDPDVNITYARLSPPLCLCRGGTPWPPLCHHSLVGPTCTTLTSGP